jgi:protein O-mannosyl-transferase
MRRIVDTAAPKLLLLAGAMVIIVACFAAYIPAIKGGFIWDDDAYVTANPLLTAPDGFYRIWFSTDAPSQYFPMTYSTYWVEYRLWGLNPMGYHAVNAAIHIINALLLWLVLRRLSIPGAWFASAVFALHPVNVESVAWITERKNVLMLFFSLLSVLCWLEFALGNKPGRKAILFYAGSLLFCALALFSKATACTLPAALVIVLWLKRMPLTARRWLQVAPFVTLGLGMGFLVMWWERHQQGTGFVNPGLSPADKLLIAGRALWFYLWELFWPANLAFSYPRWHINPAAVWQYAWPAASVLALVCAWLWRERIGRATAAAILFFVAMLFPMLGFFPLYTFVYCFVADHYQYAAAIGPVVLVAAGGVCVMRRLGTNGKTVMLSAAGVLLLTLGVLTWRQCRIYTNNEALWLDTIEKNPDSWLAHSQIGGMLFRQGRVDEARVHMERVLGLASYVETIHPRAFADLHCNLAAISEAEGRLDDAAGHYQKALEIFENAALTHYWLANVLVRQGKVEQAIPHFNRALEIAKAKKADNLAEEIRQQLKSLEGR